MSSNMSRKVRLRMTETGEKYTTALRAIEADPEESARLDAILRRERVARKENNEDQ